jgi:hypothetical protein
MARLTGFFVLGLLVLRGSVSMLAQSTTSATSDRTIQSVASHELPDSPGTVWAKSQAPAAQTPASETTSPQSNSPTNAEESASQVKGDKSDQKLQQPVGTAAAEAPKVSGITAAQPAGSAIAPAKQHRVRTIVLKVGAILAAGVAVGTVVALSAATPSKPPGAH